MLHRNVERADLTPSRQVTLMPQTWPSRHGQDEPRSACKPRITRIRVERDHATRRRSGQALAGGCQFAASEKSSRVTTHQTPPENDFVVMELNDRAQNRRGLFRRRRGCGMANCFRGNPMLEREAEQHAGVARDRRMDVVPGLAAVNEDSPGVPSA